MKKKEKTVCQIIRFRGKIEAFLVSIDEFAISTIQPRWRWDDMTPMNLIPTNTGELGLGGPANI